MPLFQLAADADKVHETLPRTVARGIGWLGVTLGALFLAAGWVVGFEATVLPGVSPIKPNTALTFVLLGASLALAETGRGTRWLSDALGMLALALGLATVAEHALHLDLRIDRLLTAGSPAPGGLHPERMGPSSAAVAGLLGAALLCAGRPAVGHIKTAAATGAVLIAWAALCSYVFGPDVLEGVPLFGVMPLHTAVMMLLLGIGLLATVPVSWPVSTMLSSGVGGLVCRWLLPPAILAPPLVGWLLTRRGVIDLLPAEFDWALYAVISSLGSVLLILSLARRIELLDAERRAAEELSHRDPLTGLANRRAFDAALAEAFRLAKRHQRPLALLLLDIDHFKAYNDEYGHPAGDELLEGLGRLLRGAARQTDLVARIGGEEFAIVLPETDLAGASHLGEHLRSVVESSAAFRRRVTVSIGMATLLPATATIAQLVSDCDVALYRAKASGRNRMCRGQEAPG